MNILGQHKITTQNNHNCKYCQSTHVIKYGTYKAKQRYFCRDCNRKFASGNTIPKMQNTTEDIAEVLNMYYEGINKSEICKKLIQQNSSYISRASVYNWIRRFTELAKNEDENHHPTVGDLWIADENVLYFNNRKYWLIDIIDDATGYLLASKLLDNRSKKDIQSCLEQAGAKAGKKPSSIITDCWKGFLDGVELAFGAESEHISTPYDKHIYSPKKIERWHHVFFNRVKFMRCFKSADTAGEFLSGWVIHYNYFRSSDSPDDKTPAELAGIVFPLKNWKSVVEQPFHITARIPIKSEMNTKSLKVFSGQNLD